MTNARLYGSLPVSSVPERGPFHSALKGESQVTSYQFNLKGLVLQIELEKPFAAGLRVAAHVLGLAQTCTSHMRSYFYKLYDGSIVELNVQAYQTVIYIYAG